MMMVDGNHFYKVPAQLSTKMPGITAYSHSAYVSIQCNRVNATVLHVKLCVGLFLA